MSLKLRKKDELKENLSIGLVEEDNDVIVGQKEREEKKQSKSVREEILAATWSTSRLEHLDHIHAFKQSGRDKKVTNKMVDSFIRGIFRKPSRDYSPYVRVSFVPKNETFETFPIYGGGSYVKLNQFDENTFQLKVDKASDWKQSYLHVELWSDTTFDRSNVLIGSNTIDFDSIIANKSNQFGKFHSRNLTMLKSSASNEDQKKSSSNKREVKGFVEMSAEMISETEISLTIEKIGGLELVRQLSIVDIVQHSTFTMSLIMAVAYVLIYASVIYCFENIIYPQNDKHISKYSTAIWFSFITLTTLGYGDYYATNSVTKTLNVIFILFNVLIVGTLITNSINMVVDHGEEIVETRLNDVMTGFRRKWKSLGNQNKNVRIKHHHKKTRSIDRLFGAFPFSVNKNEHGHEHGHHHGRHKKKRHKHKHGNKKRKEHNKEVTGNKYEKLSSPHDDGMESMDMEIISSASSFDVHDDDNGDSNSNSNNANSSTKSVDVEVGTITNPKMEQLQMETLTQMRNDELRNFRKRIIIDGTLMVLVGLFGIFVLAFNQLLVNANGQPLDPWIDGLHYVVVSMSTVGYGDIYPRETFAARLFSSIFLLFGTVVLLRGLQVYVEYIQWNLSMEKHMQNVNKIFQNSNWFENFDINKDGIVSKYEFLRALLVRLNYVKPENINRIMTQFHAIDFDGCGTISRDDLKHYIAEQGNIKKYGKKAYYEIKNEWKIIGNEIKRLKEKENDLNKREKQLDDKEKRLSQLMNDLNQESSKQPKKPSLTLSGSSNDEAKNDNDHQTDDSKIAGNDNATSQVD